MKNVARIFEEKCIRGLTINEDRCGNLVEKSLAVVTALVPKIGYDAAAEIAREAHAAGKTIREVCLEKNLLPEDELNDLLDARKQTGK